MNVYDDISGVYNLNANKSALFQYGEETINLDTEVSNNILYRHSTKTISQDGHLY